MSDQPVPGDVRGAVDRALDDLPQPASRHERDRWRIVSRIALDAAEPLIRADERRRIAAGVSVDDPAPEDERLGLYRLAAADGALAERERIRKRFSALAAELERQHEPASEPCTHAEGIRLAIGYLDLPEGDPNVRP